MTVIGIGIAWRLYRPSQEERWISFPEREPGMAGALGHAFYIDDLYAWVVSDVGPSRSRRAWSGSTAP